MNTDKVELYFITEDLEFEKFLTVDFVTFEAIKNGNVRFTTKNFKFMIATGLAESITFTNTFNYNFYEFLDFTLKPFRTKLRRFWLTDFKFIEGWRGYRTSTYITLHLSDSEANEFELSLSTSHESLRTIKMLTTIFQFLESKETPVSDKDIEHLQTLSLNQ